MCSIFDEDRVFITYLNELVPETDNDVEDLFLGDVRAP